MTRDEGAILTAYTGLLLGPFDAFHEYVERLLGRPVFTHELGGEDLCAEIKELSRPEFVSLVESIK